MKRIDVKCRFCFAVERLKPPCSSCGGTFCVWCHRRHSCVIGALVEENRKGRARAIEREMEEK
jgi:hypothetical protein